MRYQRVLASSREISFARQFFRMNLFIIAMEQNFGDPLSECFRSKIALNSPTMANRKVAACGGKRSTSNVSI